MELPRFLFDDTTGLTGARVFVVHTLTPRFVGELLYEGEDFGTLEGFTIRVSDHYAVVVRDWIDPAEFDPNELIPAMRDAILTHAEIRG